jgi:hypothetical protein
MHGCIYGRKGVNSGQSSGWDSNFTGHHFSGMWGQIMWAGEYPRYFSQPGGVEGGRDLLQKVCNVEEFHDYWFPTLGKGGMALSGLVSIRRVGRVMVLGTEIGGRQYGWLHTWGKGRGGGGRGHGGGFVHVDHRRLAYERNGNAKSPLHAPAELAHPLIGQPGGPKVDTLKTLLYFNPQLLFLRRG